MKKIIFLSLLLFMTALIAPAQWVRDASSTYLKQTTDKVGIGITAPAEKLTIVSQAGEALLGLKTWSTQSNPVIKIMNSSGTSIWGLYAKSDWWTIGSSIDSTTALLSGKTAKRWLRLNGKLYLYGNGTITGTLGVTGATTLSSTLGVTGATTVTGGLIGTSATRGSGNFTTTATRTAVYIAGATSSDYYIVRGIATDAHTRPVAGDLLNCFAKTDSLIVMRAAGTTSGMGFTYFRIK